MRRCRHSQPRLFLLTAREIFFFFFLFFNAPNLKMRPMKAKGQADSSSAANCVLVPNVCTASVQQKHPPASLTPPSLPSHPPYFLAPFAGRAEELNVPLLMRYWLSLLHTASRPLCRAALLCIREELLVPLALKEGNGTDPTMFHRWGGLGLP